jgi:hypothetical protein
LDPVLVAVALATGAVWLVAAGILYLSRRPAQPSVGERTLELGPEPPAVANFLVNDWRLTDEALPATVIDLAARDVVDIEQRGPGVFYVRLRDRHDESLTAYEKRVLDHLRERAHEHVVPAEALTTGPEEAAKRWRRRFANEVVADAQARGLSRDAFDGRAFTLLLAAAVVPGTAVWALSDFQAGFVTWAAAGAILEWIRRRHPQRETPEGLVAASRWLGFRAELAENEEFHRHSPLTVELWSRLLAFGSALGVATGASAPLPMGAESDTEAWSAHGGSWRPVRVAYPRLWPPAWGLDPLVGIVAGIGAAGAGALALYWFGPPLADAGPIGVAILLVPCAAVLLGVALTMMALLDLGSMVEVTGPILRLREFGSDERRRYYAAIDDGSSRRLRALRLNPRHYVGLRQGQLVTLAATRNLGCVRWILDASGSESA